MLSFAYSKNFKSNTITSPLHVTDWFKTISSIAKINYIENKIKPLDGFDFSDYFHSSERIASDRLILININELSASLIKNNWKLIYHSSLPNKIQLFNLLDDLLRKIIFIAKCRTKFKTYENYSRSGMGYGRFFIL